MSIEADLALICAIRARGRALTLIALDRFNVSRRWWEFDWLFRRRLRRLTLQSFMNRGSLGAASDLTKI